MSVAAILEPSVGLVEDFLCIGRLGLAAALDVVLHAIMALRAAESLRVVLVNVGAREEHGGEQRAGVTRGFVLVLLVGFLAFTLAGKLLHDLRSR